MEVNYLQVYKISDVIENFSKVQNLLKNAWWCKDISIEEIKKGALNSALNIAIYYNSSIIGFSRVISDKTRFAYLMDVYVDEKHRKKGIAKAMVNFALSHPELKDVYQWLLRTTDAHGIYKTLGFASLNEPREWMNIMKPRPSSL